MEVKISNGTVTIKDVYTRKTQKEYNRVLSEDVKMNADQSGQANVEGFSMETVDKANDALLLNMVEKIIIDGKEQEIKQETFDGLAESDVDAILQEIDKVSQGGDKKK